MTYTALREALIEIRAAVDDPMWANHSEVSKNALKRWSKAIVAHLAQQQGTDILEMAAGFIEKNIIINSGERNYFRSRSDGDVNGLEYAEGIRALKPQPDTSRDEKLSLIEWINEGWGLDSETTAEEQLSDFEASRKKDA